MSTIMEREETWCQEANPVGQPKLAKVGCASEGSLISTDFCM